MVKLIGLGIINRFVFFPLGLLLFYILREIVYQQFFSKQNDIKDKITVFAFLIIFTKVFSGIFYIISNIIIKIYHIQKVNTLIINNERHDEIKEVLEKKKSFSYILVLLLLLLMSFIDVLGLLFLYLPRNYGERIDTLFVNIDIIPRTSFIFVTCLLCNKILKYTVKKHQIFSFILIGIGVLVYSTSMILWVIEQNTIHFNGYSVIASLFMGLGILFLVYGTIALIEVLEKYLMEIHYVNPYLIVFFEGLFDVILFLCYFAIFGNITEEFFQPLSYVMKNNPTGITLFVIVKLLFDLCRIQTNYHFSPTLRFIVDMLHSFMILFMINLMEKDILFLVLAFGGFFFSFSGSLIYNEFIVLYCFGLGFNTNKAIESRATMEPIQLTKAFEKESPILPDDSRNTINID